MTMTSKKGIVESIRDAKTASEVSELLRKLDGYKQAHQKTVRRAHKAAAIRKAKLKNA